MSEPLAPSRSLRPAPRVTPEERRAREMDMAEEFAALEQRADMDPWLADNPLRRLGYREVGGLRGMDYLPLAPNTGSYYGLGYGAPELEQELFGQWRSGGGLPVFDSIEMMDPERHRAFDSGESQYLIPPRTMAVGPNYYTEAILAHESGHAGVDVINDLLLARPELRDRFYDAGVRPFLDMALEEALVELGDDLGATWVQPRGEGRPVGTYQTVEHTVQFLPDRGTQDFAVSEREFEGVQRYNQIAQTLAQEELTRRGEPPRAVMREPEPGNIFYREPEPEPRGGLLGLLDRIRGN